MAYALKLRSLVCPSCGAPASVPGEGARLYCGYCGALSEWAPVRMASETVGERRPESERVQLLRASADARLEAPASLRAFTLQGLVPPPLQGPAREEWSRLLAHCRAGASDFLAQERLFFLAKLLADTALSEGEHFRARTIFESSREALRDARFRHLLACDLTCAAVSAGEIDAAEGWLGTCDPTPLDIVADSALRRAQALVGAYGKDPARVLGWLGREGGDLPISPTYRAACDLLRADGLEMLGAQREASGALRNAISRGASEVEALVAERSRFRTRDLAPRAWAECLPSLPKPPIPSPPTFFGELLVNLFGATSACALSAVAWGPLVHFGTREDGTWSGLAVLGLGIAVSVFLGVGIFLFAVDQKEAKFFRSAVAGFGKVMELCSEPEPAKGRARRRYARLFVVTAMGDAFEARTKPSLKGFPFREGDEVPVWAIPTEGVARLR